MRTNWCKIYWWTQYYYKTFQVESLLSGFNSNKTYQYLLWYVRPLEFSGLFIWSKCLTVIYIFNRSVICPFALMVEWGNWVISAFFMVGLTPEESRNWAWGIATIMLWTHKRYPISLYLYYSMSVGFILTNLQYHNVPHSFWPYGVRHLRQQWFKLWPVACLV